MIKYSIGIGMFFRIGILRILGTLTGAEEDTDIVGLET